MIIRHDEIVMCAKLPLRAGNLATKVWLIQYINNMSVAEGLSRDTVAKVGLKLWRSKEGFPSVLFRLGLHRQRSRCSFPAFCNPRECRELQPTSL